jgi:DNA polymerase-3 subunit beta|nr:MAG TPA: beta clamp protein [Caudoviricetes sp.]
MNIRVNKSEFVKGLLVGGSFAGRTKFLPILDCVKIKVKNGSMVIVSSDNENAISKRIFGVESDGEVSFCAGYKSLLSYVKLIKSEFIDLVVDDEVKNLEVKHDKGSVSLPLSDASEFPSMQPDENAVCISMDSALLNNWIVDGQVFVGNDELRPQMGCILIYKSGNEIGCAASDGHKLFCDYINNYSGDDFDCLINKNAFNAICNVCKISDTITLKTGKSNTLISGKDVTIITRNINQKYPNFKSVLVKDSNIKVVVNKNELKEAICRCMVGANQTNLLLKFELDGTSLNLSSEDIDFSIKSVENLIVNSNGKINIGFKAPYFLNTLNTISTDDVIIELKESSRPALFKESGNKSNKLSLLMPMML